MAEDGVRSLLASRRAWGRLPRRRRRALWSNGVPNDRTETEIALGFARYLRSPIGDIEWVLAGVLGVLGGYAVLQFLALDQLEMTGRRFAGWVAAWAFAGLYLRRWRATDIEGRAGTAGPWGPS